MTGDDQRQHHYVGDGCPGGHLPWELPGHDQPDPALVEPVVLHGVEDGSHQQQSILVRIGEPGAYYLHLVQAGDGRVWAVLGRDPSPGINGEPSGRPEP